MKNHSDLLAAAKGKLTRNPEPAPLHAVPEPAEDTGPATQPVPVAAAPAVVLPGRQMSVAGQVRHSFALARLARRELRVREGSLFRAAWHAQSPSMAMQAEYAKSRRWVKPGHEGGVSDRAGGHYQAVIGKPGVALGLMIAGISSRGLAAGLAYFVFALPLALLGLYVTGLHAVALWIVIINAVVISVYLLGLRLTAPGRDDGTEYAEPADPEEG